MGSRDDQIDKMAATMKEWAAEMDKYEARLQKATDEQKAQVETYLADLRKRYVDAEEHMKKVRENSEAASRDMMEGFQRMADDFMAALTKARDRF